MIIFMQLMILVSALKYLIVHMTKDAQSFSLTNICCLRYLQHSTRIHGFMPQAAHQQEQDCTEWASTNIWTLQKKTLTLWMNLKVSGNGTGKEKIIRH